MAAHPDDEVLGCGGSICLHRNAGHSVTVMIAAGRSAAESSYGVRQSSLAGKALAELGVEDVRLLDLPDQQLDTYPVRELARPIEALVAEIEPTVVYCHHGGDVNQDHSALFRATLVAVRPVVRHIRAVYAFETVSSTEWSFPVPFVADTWVDISSVLDAKLRALSCYAPELRPYPHPRSIDAVRHRAMALGHQCCLESAEIFMTIRRICANAEALV